MFGRAFRSAFLLALLAAAPSVSAAAQTLERVAERGEVAIGVTNTFRPYGYVEDDGRMAGLEIDLAHSIAEFLGVKERLVPVAAANRIPWLRQGRIDLTSLQCPGLGVGMEVDTASMIPLEELPTTAAAARIAPRYKRVPSDSRSTTRAGCARA